MTRSVDATNDIQMREGVPYAETVTIGIEGVTAQTTGYAAELRVARRGAQILELTEGDGITTTAGVDEVAVTIALDADAVALLTLPAYDYELDLMLDGDVILRPLIGALWSEQSVVE